MSGPIKFGVRNPNAPAELDRLAFLIGEWRCDARLLGENGSWQSFRAEWVGRLGLDGYAVADEFRLIDGAGKLLVLGFNLRTYDPSRKRWNMRWLHALEGSWTDLAPEEFGGVQFNGRSFSYVFREPMVQRAYTRATYTPDSESQFTWKGERSNDRTTWAEFMEIVAHREE
jgi:hypothetical protein